MANFWILDGDLNGGEWHHYPEGRYKNAACGKPPLLGMPVTFQSPGYALHPSHDNRSTRLCIPCYEAMRGGWLASNHELPERFQILAKIMSATCRDMQFSEVTIREESTVDGIASTTEVTFRK